MVNLSPSSPISSTIDDILSLAEVSISAIGNVSLDYSETAGAWTLRQAIAALYDDLKPEQVIVTNGAVESIAITLAALVEPGTRVVLEDPIYGSYGPLLNLLGAEVTRYELAADNAYGYDFARLEELVRAKRSQVVIVNPYNNPTGRGLSSASSLASIAALSERTGARLVCDEVFRHISLHGEALPSALDLSEGAVAIGDMTKAWGLGGLRIGWLACRDTAVMERALNTRDFTTNSNSSVSEVLAELALSVREQLLDDALRSARRALSVLDQFVADCGGAFSWHRPIGGYCGWLQVQAECAKPVVELCAELAETEGFLFLPGAVFGPRWDRFLRVGMAADSDAMVAGLEAFLEASKLT